MQRRKNIFKARSTRYLFSFQPHMSDVEQKRLDKRRRRKFMRRPCEILNLRFRVHWVWEACTSFNLEWNCFNIHAIVYYECFFHTTSSFWARTWNHLGKFIIFVVDSNHRRLLCAHWMERERKIIGETAYFVCCASFLRHISAQELGTLRVFIAVLFSNDAKKMMENLNVHVKMLKQQMAIFHSLSLLT